MIVSYILTKFKRPFRFEVFLHKRENGHGRCYFQKGYQNELSNPKLNESQRIPRLAFPVKVYASVDYLVQHALNVNMENERNIFFRE